MSAPKCLRCLVRPSGAGIPVSVPRARAPIAPITAPIAAPIAASRPAPFSTTSANAKPKQAQNEPASKKAGKKLQLGKFKKKDRIAEKGRPPLPGERKAYRKRITLSNDNAIPVPWLTDLGPADLATSENIAKVMALPEELQDQLRASVAFKPTQCWGMFRKPAVLVRKETVDLTNRMQEAAANRQILRLVVTGDKVAGKSLMLLQAMSHAFLNDWIVLHFPEAQELTTACTEYAPIPGTDPVQYMQPVYVLKLIQAFRRANEKVLSKTYTTQAHPQLPQNISANTPLLTLANLAKEPDNAWAVFQALWNELTARGASRPPILISLDGLAHAMKVSDYRSPSFELIHSHDLALLRLFANALGGGAHFPGGGAVLAATSRSNAPRAPSMELALAQREAEQRLRADVPGVQVPQKDPYFRGYDERVEAVLRSVQVLRLGGLDKLEARALMEYWAASGMLRATVNERTVTEKWTLAGHGVVGEMERAALLTMRI
ncbi:mitochondrial 37S ribosomal protein mS29 [Thermothelomyces heterothallicus CBS 202.75]|uniref:mitochondrial 37S ribosomal protein mS29 n=1 Tax=Thermothelomyces heterothallicus CBS 202.75 TaxID=1149848 RepID=UPI003743B64D